MKTDTMTMHDILMYDFTDEMKQVAKDIYGNECFGNFANEAAAEMLEKENFDLIEEIGHSLSAEDCYIEAKKIIGEKLQDGEIKIIVANILFDRAFSLYKAWRTNLCKYHRYAKAQDVSYNYHDYALHLNVYYKYSIRVYFNGENNTGDGLLQLLNIDPFKRICQ